jgi:hypothetical protein
MTMSAKPMTITGVHIVTIERLRLSSNGNPRFLVTSSNGTVAQTQSDASLNYGIENRSIREARDLTVKFSRAGKITRLCVTGTSTEA